MKVIYGKSMYGGWYAEYFAEEWHGIHAKTLRALDNKLNELFGNNWIYVSRIDN